MKKYIAGVMLVIMVTLLSAGAYKDSQTYCDGWDKGYKAGYCFEIQNCIEPVVPTCPIPKIGFETYQDGYNRGFTKGKSKQ